MADSEYETAISNEEQLEIVKGYLLSSPPGQIHEIYHDIAKLVPPHVLDAKELKVIMQEYNTRHYLPVKVPDTDYKMLICKDAEADNEHYIDPISKQVYTFNHTKQQIESNEPIDASELFESPYEEERVNIQNALQSYLRYEYMHEGAAGVYIRDTKLIINFCTERINLRNFWSGRWKSQWIVDMQKQPLSIAGQLHLHVHYYENGNLQLQATKDLTPVELQKKNLGDEILSHIKSVEDEFQKHLEDMYLNMSQETFKEMRRIMPITQTKMEWNLHAHRTARSLGQK